MSPSVVLAITIEASPDHSSRSGTTSATLQRHRSSSLAFFSTSSIPPTM